MFKIKIYLIGKTKERWLQEAFGQYCTRLKGTAEIELITAKDNKQLCRLADEDKQAIALDEKGEMFDSVAFSEDLYRRLIAGGGRLSYIIGGAEGLPQAIRESHALISLSPLTFTHQCVRLILIEQIYRAFEIEKKSPYHK